MWHIICDFFKKKNIYKEWICKSGIIGHDVISQPPASPTPGTKGKTSGFNFPLQWGLRASAVKKGDATVSTSLSLPMMSLWLVRGWSEGLAHLPCSLRQDRTVRTTLTSLPPDPPITRTVSDWIFAWGNFGLEVWLALCVLKYGGCAFYRHSVKTSLPLQSPLNIYKPC